MKFDVKVADVVKVRCDAVVVNLFEGTAKPGGATAQVDAALGGAITSLIKTGEFKGKAGEVHVLHSLGKMPARLVAVAGLGNKEDFTADRVRGAMGEAIRALSRHQCSSAATILHGTGAGGLAAEKSAEAIAEGCMLGAYKFKRHITKKDEGRDVKDVMLVVRDAADLKPARNGVEAGTIVAESTMLARDMVNEPSNHMTPTHMAAIAAKVAEECGLDIVVMDRKQMEKEGMGGLLGVAQGTSQPPKFMVLIYKGNAASRETAAFVGKGLTFDSGGISLKPAESMSDMKGDMAGGAAVISAIRAVARLGLKINLAAVVPATENLPGGRALKPGDVLKALNGKTIEVVNTDAEGRLILSDALSYAVKKGWFPVIDLATLTGACHVALGDLYAGVFSNNQGLADRVLKAGAEAGERLWQLPLPEEYRELNKSDVADVKNSGGRYGGAITAALFLQEFAGDKPWLHMDIAGPFMSEKDKGVLVKGATGFGTRTLIRLAINMSK